MLQTLRLDSLKRVWGDRLVLSRVSAEFSAGQGVLLAGPNGSGKTTLLRLLSAALKPSAGKILINGQDIYQQISDYRKMVGAVWDVPGIYLDLTLQENILFFCGLAGLSADIERYRQELEQLNLADWLSERPRNYSYGMRRKAAMLLSFLHSPQIKLLDEPEAGLDEKSRQVLLQWVAAWKERGDLVLIASHNRQTFAEVIDQTIELGAGPEDSRT